MGEVERRRGYGWNRVLIESARILAPEFDDAVVFLSGAQIEMLRNVTQYLNRLGTYAAEYNPAYYLVPTDEDFDDILEIVADLEETLMGNPNTIWGYKETYRDDKYVANVSAGFHQYNADAIAAGRVARLEGIAWKNDATVMSKVIVRLESGGDSFPLVEVTSPEVDKWYIYNFNRTMEEGDYVTFLFYDCALNDGVNWQMVGYQMEVPD